MAKKVNIAFGVKGNLQHHVMQHKVESSTLYATVKSSIEITKIKDLRIVTLRSNKQATNTNEGKTVFSWAKQ